MDLSTPNTQRLKALQQNFRNCLGISFWDNHEESPMLLQYIRMITVTHELFDQDIKVFDLFKTKQKRDEFLDRRFPGFRKCFTAMGPYLDEAPEDATGRIAHELQNGNMFWFNWFTEFLHWVDSSSPSRFSDELKTILDLDPWENGRANSDL